MVNHARCTAVQHGLTNVQYRQVSDLSGPFGLSDGACDLIRIQQLDLPRVAWPRTLAECFRLLRPGGQLCLLAWEWPLTNAPAWEELARLSIEAQGRVGQSVAPGQRHLGLLSALEPLCFSAGFRECTIQLHAINCSYGALGHREWQHALLLPQRTHRLLLDLQLASDDQVRALCRRQQQEMRVPAFQGLLPIMSVWATKPQ